MRSPIAKIAFLPADARTATRSGGRQPPVVRQPCLQGRFRTRSPRPSHRQPGAGGVSPPWITKTRLQRRSPNTRETADAAPENLIAIAAARITARLLRFAILLTCASSSHGGLTPAALVNVRSRIARIAFLRRHEHRTRSGGRKPPVVSQTRLQVRFQHVADNVRRPLHGGLTPAALVRACGDDVPVRGESLLRRPYRDHGGLTPAALVNMRSRIAKIAFSPADARTATKSGGRKPPVDYENALATTIPQYAGDCRRRTREPHCNRSSQNHGALIAVCDSPYMCVVEPRRAHARRSCARAFVHREWRFMQCTNVAHQERSV
jgi:hypothetical protein